MLTLLAYSMVIVFMALIMTKRLSAMVALILVPIAFGAIGGFGPELGPMMLDGVKKLAPTGVMLMFAILYFGGDDRCRPVRSGGARDSGG
ncbi:hypothetical protein ACU4HD_10185 [Cupriavidus basilensis]